LQPIRAMTDNHGLNLKPHRAPVSVWDRRGWNGTREHLPVTRLLIGVGGGALALHGLRNRTVTGRLLAWIGGTLVWWALTSEGDLSEERHWFGQLAERAGWRTDDLVHDASADSFPASDPPSFTATVGIGLRGRPRER